MAEKNINSPPARCLPDIRDIIADKAAGRLIGNMIQQAAEHKKDVSFILEKGFGSLHSGNPPCSLLVHIFLLLIATWCLLQKTGT